MSTDRPGLLPLPPADLDVRDLPLTTVRPPWYRCSRLGRDVVFFGASGNGRFDDPLGEYGVLYAALEPHTAFIEVFGGQPFIPRHFVLDRTMATLSTDREASIVDLRGPQLARLGIDARVAAADHRPAQAWSRALYLHPSRPDGILYRSRRDPSRFALGPYQREEWTFRVDHLPQTVLTDLADEYGIPVL